MLAPTVGDEVVQMAIQMEETGRDFYEAVGSATTDPEIIKLCQRLAAEESNHREVFRKIRSELARQGETIFLRDDQIAEARRAAKESILPNRETIYKVVTTGNVADLLAVAIQMERDAIRFYSGIAENIPDRTAVEVIIQEEQGHLRVLSAASDRTKTNA
jgi:rubrerythrin